MVDHDPHPAPDPGPAADVAERFEDAFRAVYLAFHRRDRKRSELGGASRAVLGHLSLTGPLTIGEAAAHLDRAQSVVSEIVAQLTAKGLLERWADPRDRRRTLVWLTPAGLERLARDREVLSRDLLAPALAAMDPGRREALFDGLSALLRAAPTPGPPDTPAGPHPEEEP